MTLIRRLFGILNLVQQQHLLLAAQQKLISDQQQELHRLHLDYTREMRGIVCSWLIHLEQPELDMRDDLVHLETVLGNSVASLEEHVVS